MLESIFRHENETAHHEDPLEAKRRDLAELVKRKESVLTWMKAGAGTAQDRELVSQLEEKILRLETELGEVHSEQDEN